MIKTPYLRKLLFINFLLYGGIYSGLMWLVNTSTNTNSFFGTIFNFIFFGGIMSYTMLKLEVRSLKKQGVFEMNSRTMNENQIRVVTTQFTKEEFYSFWKNSKQYN